MNPRPNTHKNAHIYFHYTQKAVPLQPRTSCPARCLVKKAGKHDTVGLFLKKAADKEEKMKPPKTIWSFCGLLFGQMGGIFTLIGLFFRIADVPARGGPDWFFIPFGAVLFLVGLVCFWKNRQWEKQVRFLKREGLSAKGRVCAVRHLVWINWNTELFPNRYGRSAPWVVQCTFCHQDQMYTVKSGLSWRKPSEGVQQPVIRFDPAYPKRACLDMDTIRWE